MKIEALDKIINRSRQLHENSWNGAKYTVNLDKACFMAAKEMVAEVGSAGELVHLIINQYIDAQNLAME